MVSHHIVSRQQLLEKFSLLVHDCFDDELIVPGYVEDGAAGPRVRELNQRLIAERVQVVIRPNAEEFTEVAECHRGVGLEAEVWKMMSWGQIAALTWKEDAFYHIKILHEYISLWLGAEVAHCVANAQLDGTFKGRGCGLLVGGLS